MIIKNKAIVADEWTVLRPDAEEAAENVLVAQGRVIVPMRVWQAQRDTLVQRAETGVWLASDDRPEDLQEDIQKFTVIAVDFPKVADGRGYSLAYLLRERLGFTGELRAIGDVLRDQLYYMQRVGFDSFALRSDKDMQAALKGLNDFSISYQASCDQSQPLFRRAQRGVL